MLSVNNLWPFVIFGILFRGDYGACENLHQDPKDPWRGLSMVCNSDDPKNSSISCHGVRIVKKVIQQLLNSATTNVEISEGISIVNSDGPGAAVRRARNLKGLSNMGPILGFLEGKELRIKLPTLAPANLENIIMDNLPKGREKGDNAGFGGGKKGDNSLLIMALVMGKMMAAIGFGGLGMLAMKAMLVSSLALMLSLIVAAKKLANNQNSSGGHHVVYAQESNGHYHKKRSADIGDHKISPYGAYASIYGMPRSS